MKSTLGSRERERGGETRRGGGKKENNGIYREDGVTKVAMDVAELSSRPGSSLNPNSGHNLYSQTSSSSLAVGNGHDSSLPGSRAPSAYLEDLFENHGNGPRERF